MKQFTQLRSGETLMITLENIRPASKINLIDLVREAGIDVSDWANYNEGPRPDQSSQNPRYCYEWSFVGPDNVVVLCLWHNNFDEENGVIIQKIDCNELETRLEGHRRLRFKKMRNAIETAYTEKIPVRVVICLSNDGTMTKVDKRVLDPEPWSVTFYENNSGRCLLERGIKSIGFADQFSVPKEDIACPEGCMHRGESDGN